MSTLRSVAPRSLLATSTLHVSARQPLAVLSVSSLRSSSYWGGTGFESYFGSFAGRVFHLLRSIPPIDAATSGGVAGEHATG